MYFCNNLDIYISHKMKSIVRFLSIILIFTMIVGCRSHHKINNNDVQQAVPQTTIRDSIDRGLKSDLITEAKSWIGTPYRYGHSEKGRGTDCSGFIMIIVNNVAGIKLPRNSAKQAEFCIEINRDQLQECDLVFFATGKSVEKISHVGMMIDNDKFIHASSSKGVIISKLSSDYYTKHLKKCARIPNL